MPNIVKECCGFHNTLMLSQKLVHLRAGVTTAQRFDNSLCKIEHAERVNKAAVLGTMKCEPTHAKLPDSAKSLKLGCVDEVENEIVAAFNPNQTMDRVTKDLTAMLDPRVRHTR